MTKDFFAHKASTFDNAKHRVDNVDNVSNTILAKIPLAKTMRVLDFGAGTGLLLERIAPYVGELTALDVSPAMNAELAKKLDAEHRLHGCEVHILEADLVKDNIQFEQAFDGIISSMTLHHVADMDSLFKQFYELVLPHGFIALADLATEDGSFHTEDTGVFHHGFEPSFLIQTAKDAGFYDLSCEIVSQIHRPNGIFDMLLLTGRKY